MKEKNIIIEQSFLDLLEDYRFREITIKMICEQAEINRSTFYAYYLDKYDLLDRMIDRHLAAVQQIVETSTSSFPEAKDKKPLVKKYLTELFCYIYENKQFFRTLMTVHPAQNFTQKFITALRSSYLAFIEQHTSLQEGKYFVNYTLGGQYGILFFWLQNDCQETPYLIADIVYRNVLRLNR